MLAVSQLIGLAGVALWVVTSGDPVPVPADAFAAAGAGLGGAVGLAALYRGLAVGAMAIVAPVSALGPAVPLAADLAQGNVPRPLQLAGIAVALAGVALLGREPAAASVRIAAGVGLALVAALGFGVFVVGLDAAADASTPWAVAIARATSTALALAAAQATSTRLSSVAGAVTSVALVGFFDTTANVLVALASTRGLVSVVAVLSSLYPVVTVALAALLLRERVTAARWLGAALALAGAALIAG